MDILKDNKDVAKNSGSDPNKNSFDPDKRIGQSEKPTEGSDEKGKDIGVGDQDVAKNSQENFDPNDRVVSIEELGNNHLKELEYRCSSPDLISSKKLDFKEFKMVDKEKIAEARKEFKEKKAELRKEWEAQNNREWPRYEKDIYNSDGNKIRSAGDCYDAHHIQPISLGGKNEVGNIVPMHALEHYDHAGIHQKGGALSKLENAIGGK